MKLNNFFMSVFCRNIGRSDLQYFILPDDWFNPQQYKLYPKCLILDGFILKKILYTTKNG